MCYYYFVLCVQNKHLPPIVEKTENKRRRRKYTDDQHIQEEVLNIIRETQIKPQQDFTSYLLEQLLFKGQDIASVSENLEKCEPWYTVGGNINRCSHYGEWYAGPYKS